MRNEVLDWIRETYVSSAVHCHALDRLTIVTRILSRPDDHSESYAVHLWFENMEQASHWDNKLGSRLRAKLNERWGEKAIAFHTYMEVTE